MNKNDEKKVSLAIKAINNADLDTLKVLLDKGLDPNAKVQNGNYMIHYAIKKLNPQAVDLLLKFGADPNAISDEKTVFVVNSDWGKEVLDDKKYELNSTTPLMALLNDSNNNFKKSRQELVKRKSILSSLIKYGANVNFTEERYGLTPLHLSANYSQSELVDVLINSGAKTDATAFSKNYEPKSYFYISLTPLTFAVRLESAKKKDVFSVEQEVNEFAKEIDIEASKCLTHILKKENGLERYHNYPIFVRDVYDLLKLTDIDFSQKVFSRFIDSTCEKLDKKNIKTKIERHIKYGKLDDESIEKFVNELLGGKADFDSVKNGILHYSHLNSWVGDISHFDKKKNVDSKVEGWFLSSLSPRRIKTLLKTILEIQNKKIDCVENFGIKKCDVIDKLKDEVYSQVTMHLSERMSLSFVENDFNNFNAKAKTEKQQKNKESSVSNLSFISKLTNKIANVYCGQISKLEKEQYLSLYTGHPGHAIYVDFKKHKNGNIARSIYNLGSGNINHSVSMENKVFPHVVKNIPIKMFQAQSNDAIQFLSRIIEAPNSFLSFNKLYFRKNERPLGEPLKDVNGLIPMKKQIAGNCTYKNNNASMRHRFQNEKLYKYVKKREKENIEKLIKIPRKLYFNKELQKDIETMKGFNYSDVMFMEKEVFRFLSKRCTIMPYNTSRKPGERIIFALNNMKNPDAIEYYISNRPRFLTMLDKISKHFKLEELKKMVYRLNCDYAIKSKKIIGAKDILKKRVTMEI